MTINIDQFPPLHRAAVTNDRATIRKLLRSAAADPNQTHECSHPWPGAHNALTLAIASNSKDVIKELVKAGATVDHRAVCMACVHGHVDIVAWFAKHRCLEQHDHRACLLRLAIEHQHVSLVREFAQLKTMAPVFDDVEWVYSSIRLGSMDLLNAVISGGAPTSGPHFEDEAVNPIILAAESGRVDLVGALLDAGVDVNEASTLGGFTPLFSASREGHLNVVKFLLDNGADPLIPTALGMTPVFIATREGRLRVVLRLLKAIEGSVSSWWREYDGQYCPLEAGIRRGDEELVEVLLDSELYVDRYLEMDRLKTLAELRGYHDISELLTRNT